MVTLDFRTLWDAAIDFGAFVDQSTEQQDLWAGTYRIARIPDWARITIPPGEQRRLLALAEDWCVDTASTLPVLAKWAAEVPGLSLRILRRDENSDFMDQYLTGGARSIPVVVVLDNDFRELGHWGPYPVPLSGWAKDHKPPVMMQEEYVKGKRTWYAKDRGETTLREVMAKLGV
ncbi:MAG: thioredoxin family protein [Gemmatimonadales bacterium]